MICTATKLKASHRQDSAGLGRIARAARIAGIAEAASSTAVGTRPGAAAKPQRQPPMKPRIAAPKRSRISTPPLRSEGKRPSVGQLPAAEKIRTTA